MAFRCRSCRDREEFVSPHNTSGVVMVKGIETSEKTGVFSVWPRALLPQYILAYRVHGMNVKLRHETVAEFTYHAI